MSIFRTTSIACPNCGGAVDFQLVHSVNADRRPDLRDEILEGRFQMQPCAGCGTLSRVEPEFNYVDLGRKQWIAAWQRTALADWATHAARAAESFEIGFGRSAPAGARTLGEGLVCRVTFGWAALREKIFLASAGLDDVTVEIAKLALIRESRTPPLMTAELRLIAIDDGKLVFAWQDLRSQAVVEYNEVDQSLIAEIEANDDWAPQREQLASELFVDVQRLFMEPAVAAAA